MMLAITSILIFTCLTSADCYIIRPGPAVEATRGEVWPKPKEQETFDGYYILSPTFEFEVSYMSYHTEKYLVGSCGHSNATNS